MESVPGSFSVGSAPEDIDSESMHPKFIIVYWTSHYYHHGWRKFLNMEVWSLKLDILSTLENILKY